MSKTTLLRHTGLLIGVFAAALALLAGMFALLPYQAARAANYGTVLISEIMYDPAAGYPPNNTEGQPAGADPDWEWVELYNPGDSPVDIGGWKLTDEENYPTLDNDYDGVCTITVGTTIPAGGFIIVAQKDISSDLPTTATLTVCDAGNRPITQTFEMGRDGTEVLALLDENDHVVAGSLDIPYPDIAGQNVGDSIGLRYPAYGWSDESSDWAVETKSGSTPYNHHTAGAPNTGWTWVTTPHTMTNINGDVVTPTEWSTTGEYLGKADNVEFYLTWNTSNLYFGMAGSNALTGTYIVALDTDPQDTGAANSGTIAPLCGTTGFGNTYKPDFAIQAGPGGMTTTQASGGGWTPWTPTATTAITNRQSSGEAEFRVALSDLGLSHGQAVGVYLFVCDSGTAVRAAWPPENVTAGSTDQLNTSLDVALVLDAPNDSQSPRYEATHMGVFTVPVHTTAADYRIWDNYMWFYVITPTTTPGGCDVVVRVMGNRLPTSQGAPARRAYEFNADACPGMAVNLNFAYEDGTAARFSDGTPANGKAQAAADELISVSENRLTFSRWDGSAWHLMPAAPDSECVWRDSTWHCPAGKYNYDWNTGINLLTIYNVSTFSTWAFGSEQDNRDPTAVGLLEMSARPLKDGCPGGGAGGALLLLGSALLLRRRKRLKGRRAPH